MISVEAASVIAQVFPVGILVLAIEIRAVDDFFAASTGGRVVLVLFGIGLTLALVGSCYSVFLAIFDIVDNVPLRGWEVVVVSISGHLLFLCVTAILVQLLWQKLGVTKNIAERAAKSLVEDPERAAKGLEYLIAHNPEYAKRASETLAALRAAGDGVSTPRTPQDP